MNASGIYSTVSIARFAVGAADILIRGNILCNLIAAVLAPGATVCSLVAFIRFEQGFRVR